MTKCKTISLWIIGAAGIIIIVLSALIVFSNHYLNKESVKENIREFASRRFSTDITFERLTLSLVYSPHVVIHQLGFNRLDKASGRIGYLKVYPSLLHLLKGNIQISRVIAENPDVTLRLHGPGDRVEPRKPADASSDIQAVVHAVLNRALSGFPDLSFRVKNGRVAILEPGGTVFQFDDIHAERERHDGVELTCRSNMFDAIKIQGSIPDPHALIINLGINLTGFRPHLLAQYLFPDARYGLSDSLMDLDIRFSSDGVRSLEAKAQGHISRLSLMNNQRSFDISAGKFSGRYTRNQTETGIWLTGLELKDPRVTVSGRFILTDTGQTDPPPVLLEVSGTDANLSSIRDLVLFMGGDNHVVQKVCNIVKQGTARHVTVRSSVNAFADLAKFENIIIEGSVTDGQVRLPKIGWELSDISGDIRIADGILEGSRLDGALKGSRARNGSLRLGLLSRDGPFHLDMEVAAELENLPSLLTDVLPADRFHRHINRIQELKGKASGRVVLGEKLNDIQVMADVSDATLTAVVESIPWPVEVDGGRVIYQGTEITAQHLRVKLGESYSTDLSGQLSWQNALSMDIESGETGLNTGELYPWLKTFNKPAKLLQAAKSLDGFVKLTHIKLKGPVPDPDKWRFDMAGEIHRLDILTESLDEPMTISGGTLQADEETLFLRDSKVEILDAEGQASLTVAGYRRHIRSALLTLSGSSGPRLMNRLAEFKKLPVDLNLNRHVSITDARISWERGGTFSLSAALSLAEGPEISGDMSLTDGILDIGRLEIKDSVSNAKIAFNSNPRSQNLSFKGNLEKTTVARILSSSPFGYGSIHGDFQFQLSRLKPLTSSLTGQFEVKEVVIPFENHPPVRVVNASATSRGNRLHVSSATLNWNDSQYDVQGNMYWSSEGVQFYADLAGEELNLTELFRTGDGDETPDKTSDDQHQRPETFADFPYQGIIQVNVDRLLYNKYIWSPFKAKVLLSEKETHITAEEANLCGIDMPGILSLSPENITLDIKAFAKEKPLDKAVLCLLDNKIRFDGVFDTKGHLTARGKRDEWVRSLNGQFEFSARNGRIYHLGLLAKIFSVINITEIFAGKLPDLTREGFGYDSIHADLTLENETCNINELVIDGSSMKIACLGTIGLEDQKLDLTVLVAPLKTVDRLIEKLPLIGDILEGTLVSIPVQVTGTLKDPTVVPLSPITIGSRILELMKRIIKIPINLVEPLLNHEKSGA